MRRGDADADAGVRACSAVVNCIVALVMAILGTVSLIKYQGGHCEQVLHVPIVWVALAFADATILLTEVSTISVCSANEKVMSLSHK
ncbi:hypothetical protein Acr_18g0009680 [Actinidia rufa]|uniref:Uncharacterized protein n=1 Tax=Actinidia rufa TaxID=165716 RepID=A0A7J0G7W5_9ERIC|nr:hypothetical protein Acr_18g0009680 [Actinidia rufa]